MQFSVVSSGKKLFFVSANSRRVSDLFDFFTLSVTVDYERLSDRTPCFQLLSSPDVHDAFTYQPLM